MASVFFFNPNHIIQKKRFSFNNIIHLYSNACFSFHDFSIRKLILNRKIVLVMIDLFLFFYFSPLWKRTIAYLQDRLT